MLLRPEQLAAHLDKPLAPLYLLHGDEPMLVIEAGDAIRAAARKQGFEEREVIVAGTGFKWDDLFMAAGNLSLFGGSKLVDLRIPSGKPGREGSEALQRYIATLGPGIVTLITLPELDWQAKKAAWVTALTNRASPSNATRRPRRACRSGSRSAWRASARARRARHWRSSRTMSRATCSPPIRRSRSSA